MGSDLKVAALTFRTMTCKDVFPSIVQHLLKLEHWENVWISPFSWWTCGDGLAVRCSSLFWRQHSTGTALTATAHLNALVAAKGNAITQCCPSLFSLTPIFKEHEVISPLLRRLVQARLTGMWHFLRDVVTDRVNTGALVTPQKSDSQRLSWRRESGEQWGFSSLPLRSLWDC